jgi:hypothetical protein
VLKSVPPWVGPWTYHGIGAGVGMLAGLMRGCEQVSMVLYKRSYMLPHYQRLNVMLARVARGWCTLTRITQREKDGPITPCTNQEFGVITNDKKVTSNEKLDEEEIVKL